MILRRNSVFISTVLFTISLLCLVPASWNSALAGRDSKALAEMDVGFRAAAQLYGQLGVACLAMICVSLIVLWMGYVKAIRWTWFLMLVIVWGWAFPLFVYPLVSHRIVPPWREVVADAFRRAGPARDFFEVMLIFMLMLIALLLPAKAFFGRANNNRQSA